MLNIFLMGAGIFTWHAHSAAFWILLVLAVVLYHASMSLMSESPWLGLGANLLCAGVLFLYYGSYGELFWFLDFEKQNIIVWFICYILSAAFFGVMIGITWGFLKMIFHLFSNPIAAIIGLVIGGIWGCLLLCFIGVMFSEHPIIMLFTIFGALGSGSAAHTPTIYVDGEGHITGRGYHGGDYFHGDNGNEYRYDGRDWHRW